MSRLVSYPFRPFATVMKIFFIAIFMARYVRPQRAADYLDVTLRSIFNYADRGYFRLYTKPGIRGVFVDLDEVDQAMRQVPRRRAQTRLNQSRPRGKAVLLPESMAVEADQ